MILSAVALFFCVVLITLWRYCLTMLSQAYKEISELNTEVRQLQTDVSGLSRNKADKL